MSYLLGFKEKKTTRTTFVDALCRNMIAYDQDISDHVGLEQQNVGSLLSCY